MKLTLATVFLVQTSFLAGNTALAASDIDCTGTMNPNSMTAKECTATGWGTNVCNYLVEARDGRNKARFRSLNDMVNLARLKFGGDVARCVERKGKAYRSWLWPKNAQCELCTSKKDCDRGKYQPSCTIKSGKLCDRSYRGIDTQAANCTDQ